MELEFTDYVAARRASLVRAVVLLGCALDYAEDIVQTALMRCHRSCPKVQRADEPEAYVYRVLVNTFRDALARRWTAEVPTSELPDSAASHDWVTGLDVRRALQSLSPDHRTVLVLRYFADLSESSTAHALGVPAGTVKSHAARAIAALSAHPDLRSLDAH